MAAVVIPKTLPYILNHQPENWNKILLSFSFKPYPFSTSKFTTFTKLFVREMKGSPIFPGFDADYYDASNSYEFDPQTDFSQFLEEARRYANDKEEFSGESRNKEQMNTEKQSKKTKKKKSWKTALFSFWKKTDKKSKQCPKEASSSSSSSMGFSFVSPKPRGHMSGPIYRNGGPGVTHRLPASGPLISLFHPKKREETAMGTPYVSLNKLNSKMPYGIEPHGPVYLVS